MGGGGLDYYDTSALLHIGQPDAAPNPELAARIEQAKAAVDAARADFEAIRGKPEGRAVTADGRPAQAVARQKLNRLQAELLALSDPAASGRAAIGVRDAKLVADTEIRIRGEAE